MSSPSRRFRIRYSKGLLPLFVLLGMGPTFSSVDVDQGGLRVRMGWAMRARIPHGSIVEAGASRPIWWAIGVHGDLHGHWLVNGSPKGIVWLRIDPPVKGRVLGVPTKLRRLGLGLEDPDGFLAALGAPAAPAPR